MASKKGKSQQPKDDPNSRIVSRNRRARHNYEILDELECGIALKGSEVKSIRNNKVSIEEAYAKVEGGEVWLLGADIAQYPQANVMNHEPRRPRKLLLKRREIHKFAESAGHEGLTLVPLSVYLTRGIIKVKLAIARGRKLHDKREALKKEDARKSIREALKHRF